MAHKGPGVEVPAQPIAQAASRRPFVWRITRVRRVLQILFLGMMAALPFANILRFNLLQGSIWLYGQEYPIGVTNSAGVPILISVLFMFALAFLVFLIGMSLIAERGFCGLTCPQNTLAEWIDTLFAYVDGHRSHWDRRPVRGFGRTPRLPFQGVRGQVVGWGLKILGVVALWWISLVSAEYLAPLPQLLRNALNFGSPQFWILWSVFGFWVLLVLILRHQWCRICPFGVTYQRGFAKVTEILKYTFPRFGDTLRVKKVESRADTCIHCGLCERACWMEIPILTNSNDPGCISCGACVDACAYALRKKGLPAIMDFVPAGDGRVRDHRTGSWFLRFSPRVVGAVVLFVGSAALLSVPNFSAISYASILARSYTRSTRNTGTFQYVIAVKNNRFTPATLVPRQTGFPADEVTFSPRVLRIPPNSSAFQTVTIRVTGNLRIYYNGAYGNVSGIQNPINIRFYQADRQVTNLILGVHFRGSLG